MKRLCGDLQDKAAAGDILQDRRAIDSLQESWRIIVTALDDQLKIQSASPRLRLAMISGRDDEAEATALLHILGSRWQRLDQLYESRLGIDSEATFPISARNLIMNASIVPRVLVHGHNVSHNLANPGRIAD